MKREGNEEHIFEKIPTGSGVAEQKKRPEVEVLKSAMMKYCFFRDASFHDHEDEYEPETGSVRTEKMNLVLASSPYNTSSALGRSNSAFEMFSRRGVEDAGSPMGSVMVSGTRRHVFGSQFMF